MINEEMHMEATDSPEPAENGNNAIIDYIYSLVINYL